MTALTKFVTLACIFCPLLVHARVGTDGAGVVTNPDGSYSITRLMDFGDSTSIEAETFCAKRNKYYYHLSTSFDVHTWTTVFKCITDKKKSERQKRLRETPVKQSLH